MTNTTIRVREIHCESCEQTIRTALSRVDGVFSSAPSQATNEVRIQFDANRVTEAQLRERLGEIGYDPVA
ncbi:MAG: heavy-metal-associated domain-containing protein [Candidatus Dormibacteria bacterium]